MKLPRLFTTYTVRGKERQFQNFRKRWAFKNPVTSVLCSNLEKNVIDVICRNVCTFVNCKMHILGVRKVSTLQFQTHFKGETIQADNPGSSCLLIHLSSKICMIISFQRGLPFYESFLYACNLLYALM